MRLWHWFRRLFRCSDPLVGMDIEINGIRRRIVEYDPEHFTFTVDQPWEALDQGSRCIIPKSSKSR